MLRLLKASGIAAVMASVMLMGCTDEGTTEVQVAPENVGDPGFDIDGVGGGGEGDGELEMGPGAGTAETEDAAGEGGDPVGDPAGL